MAAKSKTVVSIVAVSLTAIGMIVLGSLAYADTRGKAVANTETIKEHKVVEDDVNKEIKRELRSLDRNKVEKEIFQMYIDADKEKFDTAQQVIRDGFKEIKGEVQELKEQIEAK